MEDKTMKKLAVILLGAAWVALVGCGTETTDEKYEEIVKELKMNECEDNETVIDPIIEDTVPEAVFIDDEWLENYEYNIQKNQW